MTARFGPVSRYAPATLCPVLTGRMAPDPGVGRLRNQTPAAALTDTGSAFLTSRVLLPDSMEAEAGSLPWPVLLLPATRCPVLTLTQSPCSRYAVSGADIGYGETRRGTEPQSSRGEGGGYRSMEKGWKREGRSVFLCDVRAESLEENSAGRSRLFPRRCPVLMYRSIGTAVYGTDLWVLALPELLEKYREMMQAESRIQ
eukprot:136331-Rhodomonas_salina.1